ANYSKAQTLYEKALSETDNIDVAVEAAFRLSRVLISNTKMSEAAKHIEKIALAKPSYFAKDKVESIYMMYDFAESNDFISAATIAKALYENMEVVEDEYEELVKNVGIWLSQSSKKKDALAALNIYIEKFPDGIYLSDVKFAKDALFFDVNDDNTTTKFETYDKLINEYSGDRIGDKALYEKMKLLIEQKMFKEALSLEDEITKLDRVEYGDVPELITDAAIGVMQLSLREKECNNVLLISSKYSIELSSEWDDGVYECAMKGGDFELAKKMADRNIKSKDLELRKKWLYRYIKIDFATGNYSNVIEASKELITLIGNDKESPYLDVYRNLFDVYQRLENRNKMIESIAKLMDIYGEDYIDIDRYAAVMGVGSEIKDTNLVIEYGDKVLNIQKNSTSKPQTPYVEFTLYEAYMQKENYDKALEVIKQLDGAPLNKNNMSRQKYLLGSVLERLWRDKESKEAYQQAIDIDPTSAWAGLAKSAKSLE
ncbi:MAG: flagellar protein, partial [Sulfurimonas sp.]|uniref:tetratricopeptide repeat protein n=1 Tax=Sulfurimonas sp. TaxID=2022749 RepID=UPI002A294835|nr:flagellar protein [Sulfurimonas sp.]